MPDRFERGARINQQRSRLGGWFAVSILTSLFLLCSCTGPPTDSPEGASRSPNVVVILADDLGYADVGFQGLQDFATPSIDALAAAGIRFPNGYVSHPYCSPSRAGLLTGRYQHRFGHVHNPKFRAGEGLPLSESMLPEVLSEEGYVSALVGKWHLGDGPEYHPLQRGFDEFYGFLGGGHDYFESTDRDAREYLIPLEANGKEIPVEGYLTDQLTDAALAFVRRNASRPFFLYLAYNAPHGPLQAPPEHLDRVDSIADTRRRTYAAMVTALDDGVGRLVTALSDLGLTNDTLFFLSDNGGPTPANASDNTPLRATKGTVYEGGVRVPFVVSWPGRLAEGESYDPPVSALDIFPTSVAVAGGELPEGLDGVDLLPFLTGAASGAPHERLFWHTDAADQHAVRQAGYKLVRVLDREAELYAIDTDISEESDIGRDESARADELMQAVETWRSAHPAPAWPGTRGDRPIHPNTVKGLGADQAEVEAWVARKSGD